MPPPASAGGLQCSSSPSAERAPSLSARPSPAQAGPSTVPTLNGHSTADSWRDHLIAFQHSMSSQFKEFGEHLSGQCLPTQRDLQEPTSVAPPRDLSFRQGTAQQTPKHEEGPFALCTFNSLDDQSPAPVLPDLAPSEVKESWGIPPDPFEGSNLSDFSLSAVGMVRTAIPMGGYMVLQCLAV